MKSISHKVDLWEMRAKWPKFTMQKRFAVVALLDTSSDEEQEEEEVEPRASKNNLGFWHRRCQQWWSRWLLWLRQIQQAPKTSCLHPLPSFSDLEGQTLRPVQRLVIKIQQQRTQSLRLEKLAQTLAKEGKTLKSICLHYVLVEGSARMIYWFHSLGQNAKNNCSCLRSVMFIL